MLCDPSAGLQYFTTDICKFSEKILNGKKRKRYDVLRLMKCFSYLKRNLSCVSKICKRSLRYVGWLKPKIKFKNKLCQRLIYTRLSTDYSKKMHIKNTRWNQQKQNISCIKRKPYDYLKFTESFNEKNYHTIMEGNVQVYIPCEYFAESFEVSVIHDNRLKPAFDSWSIIASNVICLGPHATKFSQERPVVVTLPLGVAPDIDDVVECYTSDTDNDEETKWQKLHDCQLVVDGQLVWFVVSHFSLFTIVVSKKRPAVSTVIKQSTGGSIKLQYEKGSIDISFASKSFDSPFINASLEVLYYDTFYVSTSHHSNMLAAPIVALGPSGCEFSKDVSLTIPLPKGDLVKAFYKKDINLKFQCSQTSVNCTPDWKDFYPSYEINWEECTVQFYVKHFTLYSVFWNILDATIPEPMKLQASHHLPHFSFWVYWQALMTDAAATEFGLCILCQRFGNTSSHLLQQYPCNVGSCNPKKIKSGKLEIQLKSGMFSANQKVGEVNKLLKTIEFDGHDIDIHFACKFNVSAPGSGVFGKVQVSSMNGGDFSFNIIKSNQKNKRSNNYVLNHSMWESKIMAELAELLNKNGDMCHEVAIALGYNRSEIQNRFTNQLQPLNVMLADFLELGGHADEFTEAICKVARLFKLLPLSRLHGDILNFRKEDNCCTNVKQQHNDLGKNLLEGEQKECFVTKELISTKRKHQEFHCTDEPLNEIEFEEIAGKISKWWKSIGRKLSLCEDELTEIDLDFHSDGEKEKAFQMLIVWRERNPDTCFPSNLYTVMSECGLRYTASKLFR